MPKSCWTGSGGTALLIGWDSPAHERKECAADASSGFFFFFFLLTFSETFKACRGETAKQRLVGLHSIIFIIHAGFPPPRPNPALPAPLPEIIKNISWNALILFWRRRERFQVEWRGEDLNVRKTNCLRNIIQDILLFVEKSPIDHSGTDYACRIR